MHRSFNLVLASSLLSAVRGQQAGTNTAETHPPLTIQNCVDTGCTSSTQSITLDANWRWTHEVGSSTNCYTGNEWDSTLCPDGATCATNCALDGADYSGTYGITTAEDALTIQFVTGSNVGSRTYLMAADDTNYEMLKLKGKEFAFDIDMSQLPCGLNGALYLVGMDEDGGMAKYSTNTAGAKYGTGYCDSQCPHDVKFINGEANVNNWTASSNDANSGTGEYGTCCTEMDVWEANSMAAAYTPHVCNVTEQTRCEGTACGDGQAGNDNRYAGYCDKDGCDFNSWRMGNQTFLGPGLTVDTNSKFTVVTQYITSDNTTTGDLTEIRRLYVQNGTVIANSQSDVEGVSGNSLTDDFCTAQKTAFGDVDEFATQGGMAAMGEALDRGMVLVMSLWDDHAVNMLWLDSTYPVNATGPGSSRGPCSTDSGVPADVESQSPGAKVTFSNIKIGDIGTTYASS